MTSNKKIARAVCAIDALRKLKTLSDALNDSTNDNQKRKPRFWVNPFLMKRADYMDCKLLKDVVWEDGAEHYNFCRMNIHKFEFIYSKVESKIKKCETAMRYPITARTRLAITLRFIATGESYKCLELAGHVSRKTISVFVPEVLQAIIDELQDEHLKMPSTVQEWENSAKDFNTSWQFPHTLGVIDGKHIRVRSQKSGMGSFNRKGLFSIILFVVIDAHSRFIHIETITNTTSDTMVFNNSKFYELLQAETLNLPTEKALKRQVTKTPFYFISNKVFGSDLHMLSEYKMIPEITEAQEIFNQRINHVRMTADIAIGKLVDRFRVFHRPLEVGIYTAEKIVKSCCVLHNFLTEKYINVFDDPIALPKTIVPLPMQLLSNPKYIKEMGENVCQYLNCDEFFTS